MVHARLFWTLLVMNVTLWAASLVIAVMYLHPEMGVVWWVQLGREPIMAAVNASVSVVLAVWKFAAPASTVWRVAYRAGQHDAQAEFANVTRLPSQRVTVLKRRRSDLS